MNQYYIAVPHDDYVVHHGVLGQKWGIRRYQNADGTLTAEGEARYLKHINKVGASGTNEEQNTLIKGMIGVTKNKNGDEILKKDANGVKVQRIANSGEKIDSRRKYVSTNSLDNDQYNSMWDMLGLNMNKPISTYEYKLKKNLKVAPAEKVTKDLLDKYGDQPVKDYYSKFYSKGLYDNSYGYETRKGDKWAVEYNKTMYQKMNSILDKCKDDEVLQKKYSKAGYDAVVDLLDYDGVAGYPLIILDPKKSLSLKKETRWNQ